MSLKDLIESKSEVTQSRSTPVPIVLSSRIRLARNFEKYNFPGWAKPEVRQEVLGIGHEIIAKLKVFDEGYLMDFEDATEHEKQVLVERHLISPEHAKETQGSGVIVSKDQSLAVMINEEDHLRMQVVRGGYHFKSAWKLLSALDDAVDKQVEYAFSPELGYLTACPTNLGTGLRASVMMHLPGLVIAGQMEKVIRACNQLNLAVRGIYGEGSEATGSIFQISNQQTLGEKEEQIIRRLTGVLDTVIEQEQNARALLLEGEPTKIYDKVGRAYGILRNGYFVNSSEALNLLSLMRLGVDFNIVPSKHRRMIDRLFIESQPAHIQYFADMDVDADTRDIYRANLFRSKFRGIAGLNFDDVSP